MTRTAKVVARLGLVALVAGVLAGCDPILLTGGGGTSSTCPAGSWTVDAMDVPAPIVTPFGTLTITQAGLGVSLNLTDTAWTLHADQMITGTLTNGSDSASGTVNVVADANGSYTSTASTITFVVGSVTGTATYDATISGNHVSGTVPLPTSGLQKLYSLSATATYGCDSNGLTLQFAGEHLHAHN